MCGNGGQCSGCARNGDVPPSVERTLSGSGQPLELGARRFMESRFSHDFSGVRVHADSAAAQSARDVKALAYTVGENVVLGAGRPPQGSPAGRWLLAHELAHVVQQTRGVAAHGGAVRALDPGANHTAESAADAAAHHVAAGERAQHVGTVGANVVQKVETLGTKVTQPKGAKAAFKKMSATFDGKDFVLSGDGKPVLTAGGQSGRPNTVRAADVKACGGSATDSYMNNPRYVGIKDNGPIPEGDFTFTRGSMVQFTSSEQRKMSLAHEGEFVDPSGSSLHGDWGAARAALNPVKIEPSKFCGDPSSRSGFFLHGGVMPGSSGCIDVGNAAITDVIAQTTGFTGAIHVKVKYTQPAPEVGWLDRKAGQFMYPDNNKKPTLLDRLGSLFH
jgi:hypothetical protein